MENGQKSKLAKTMHPSFEAAGIMKNSFFGGANEVEDDYIGSTKPIVRK